MANFKLKRRPDLPSGSGLVYAEMTLAEHIASSAPHPNWNPSGSGSGGTSGEYAPINHNHDSSYLKLSNIIGGYNGAMLSNIFALVGHTHNYAATDHNHDLVYVRRDEYSGGSGGSGGGSASSSSDGLIIPEPYHSVYYNNDISKPKDIGVVDANRLIADGRYVIDATQSEQLYNDNGSVETVSAVTLQNLNAVNSGILITRVASNPILTTSDLKKVWKIFQVLYSDSAIWIRFGSTEYPDGGFTFPSTPNSIVYNVSNDEYSYYTQKIETYIATTESMKATKTVTYNVKSSYSTVVARRDDNGNVLAPIDSNIWNTDTTSESGPSSTFEYEILSYTFGSWKSTTLSEIV